MNRKARTVDSPPANLWTEESQKRLQALYVNQLKVDKILKVLGELLRQKGIQSRR